MTEVLYEKITRTGVGHELRRADSNWETRGNDWNSSFSSQKHIDSRSYKRSGEEEEDMDVDGEWIIAN
ncbi:hypothetical protein L5515_015902 [Caenorhabditis briggsae]|uniref:Uncharacterized protein n=1 Tax=Caenorhabditis briggsae TaxID=6238 RepID=A0AAE9ECX3_CAEBR|nr:hypothetical protein L5515_015902 [Caenorhabditis briggsae]